MSCRAGWGGGEPQHFSLSVLEVEGGLQTEVASNRSSSPELTVRGLSPARPYLLAVTAANTRGRSDPVFVPAEVEAAARVQAEQTSKKDKKLAAGQDVSQVKGRFKILSRRPK